MWSENTQNISKIDQNYFSWSAGHWQTFHLHNIVKLAKTREIHSEFFCSTFHQWTWVTIKFPNCMLDRIRTELGLLQVCSSHAVIIITWTKTCLISFGGILPVFLKFLPKVQAQAFKLSGNGSDLRQKSQEAKGEGVGEVEECSEPGNDGWEGRRSHDGGALPCGLLHHPLAPLHQLEPQPPRRQSPTTPPSSTAKTATQRQPQIPDLGGAQEAASLGTVGECQAQCLQMVFDI